MKKFLILLYSFGSLMAMDPAANLLKVSASQLPFNPFIPRIAFSHVACSRVATSTQQHAMVDAVMPAITQGFNSLAYTTLACRPTTAQAYVPRKKVLELTSKTSCEDVGLPIKQPMPGHFVGSFLKKYMPDLTTGSLKRQPLKASSLPLFFKVFPQLKIIDCSKKIFAVKPSQLVGAISGRIASSCNEEFDEIIQMLDDVVNDTSWKPAENDCIVEFEYPSLTEISFEKEQKDEAQKMFDSDSDTLSQAVDARKSNQSRGILKKRYSVSDRIKKKVSWSKDLRKDLNDDRIPAKHESSAEISESEKLLLVTVNTYLAQQQKRLMVQRIYRIAERRASETPVNVVNWHDVPIDQQDVLVQTGAIPVQEQREEKSYLSWWERMTCATKQVIEHLDREHPGMC